MRISQIGSLLAGAAVFAFSSCTSIANADGVTILSKGAKKPPSSSWATRTSNGFHPAEVDLTLLEDVASLPKDKHGMPTYRDTMTHRVVRTTAYSHMENEPGAPGRKNAACGILQYGKVRSAAADWSLYPVGTKFRIKGLPHLYVIDDYGSALVGTNTIDIYHPTLKSMNKWGTRKAEIDIIQWGSWERTLALLKGRTGYKHCAKMYYAARKKVDNGTSVVSLSRPYGPQG